ncbi:hypothetical protein AB0442_41390 [Kitasatospora sp. NPDC085895]|uniref:hypothetical protein n=1 Tax=Kitasatospora sp. NPDC085895 TaxID=3155057 RepID=UPI00344BB6D0
MSQPHPNQPYQPGPQWGAPPPKQPSFLDWVKAHKAISAVGAGVAVVIVGAAMASGAGNPPPAPSTPTPPVAAAAPAQSAPAAAPAATTPTATVPAAQTKQVDLPNFVGMGLQSAQDKAQASGFYFLTSHDALGRSRMQLDDRNWKVCTQSPAAGQQKIDVKVDMGAVKLDENCPAQDQGASTPKAAGSMPDFRGKSMAAVRDAMDRSTSFQVKDLLEGRMVLLESNWQVCTQDPKPGTALNGQPVSLGVVKFEEKCP